VAPYDARIVRGLPGAVLGSRLKARPAIGLITLDTKPAGERRTGNPSAPFDRAGAGDGRMAYRASPRPYSGQDVAQKALAQDGNVVEHSLPIEPMRSSARGFCEVTGASIACADRFRPRRGLPGVTRFARALQRPNVREGRYLGIPRPTAVSRQPPLTTQRFRMWRRTGGRPSTPLRTAAVREVATNRSRLPASVSRIIVPASGGSAGLTRDMTASTIVKARPLCQ
jgi:hypothetical protein